MERFFFCVVGLDSRQIKDSSFLNATQTKVPRYSSPAYFTNNPFVYLNNKSSLVSGLKDRMGREAFAIPPFLPAFHFCLRMHKFSTRSFVENDLKKKKASENRKRMMKFFFSCPTNGVR